MSEILNLSDTHYREYNVLKPYSFGEYENLSA